MKKIVVIGAAIALPILLGAGSCSSDEATRADEAQINEQLAVYQKNQPTPRFDWSQYRQTVIDLETAQANVVATTSFFFNAGVNTPFKTCPSIGFPVATTSQLTNPWQLTWNSSASGTVGQMEPTGVFTGDSSGTYVVCIAPNGDKYLSYWEGFIDTEGGPAEWVEGKGIVMTGPATAVSTEQK
jgi:type II secretory pathway pseudopilin PulG